MIAAQATDLKQLSTTRQRLQGWVVSRVKLSVGTIHTRELSRCMSWGVGRFDSLSTDVLSVRSGETNSPLRSVVVTRLDVTVQTKSCELLTSPVTHYRSDATEGACWNITSCTVCTPVSLSCTYVAHVNYQAMALLGLELLRFERSVS